VHDLRHSRERRGPGCRRKEELARGRKDKNALSVRGSDIDEAYACENPARRKRQGGGGADAALIGAGAGAV
jgi:hypothetical protein